MSLSLPLRGELSLLIQAVEDMKVLYAANQMVKSPGQSL